MPNTLNDAAAAPAALSAFLRGVERRGALFGELQCGDREAGDTALAAAMRAFRKHAASVPMAGWPARFWTLLAATPQLRQTSAMAHWPPELQALATLPPEPRQALLLRLAAGLAEEQAAPVLGLSLAAYEAALAAACPRDAEGAFDAQAWRALAEAIQQRLRELSPERLARLARLREDAIAGTRVSNAPAPAAPRAAPVPVPRRRRWPWIALALALSTAALLATWWWPQWQASHRSPDAAAPAAARLGDTPSIRSEPLPDSAPAARFDARTAVLTHPDFELLRDQSGQAFAHQADFYAWYAAAGPTLTQDLADAAPAVAAADASAGAEAASDPQPQATTPPQQAPFAQRLAAWEALPPAQREDRRARYAAWRALDPVERATLRGMAARIAAFPPERRQALQAQFALLNDTQQRGWRLGSALGGDYEKLFGLLAYVPETQRPPLLATLRALSQAQRDELALLAQRTPPQDRPALRSELLAVPAAQRGAWLQRKLGQ
jgi:hypothetical protein